MPFPLFSPEEFLVRVGALMAHRGVDILQKRQSELVQAVAYFMFPLVEGLVRGIVARGIYFVKCAVRAYSTTTAPNEKQRTGSF